MDKLDLAVHAMAHVSLPSLAKTMGVNEQSLRNKVSPTNDIAKVSVQEFRSMMLITQDLQPLRVLADDFGMKLVKSNATELNVFDALLCVGKEQGDVVNSLQEALKDNVINAREYCEIEREVEEAKVALDTLLLAVKSHQGVKR